MKKYKNDLILVFILCLLILGCILFIKFFYAAPGEYVEIMADGEQQAVLKLSEDTEYKLEYNGQVNIIEIKDGYVFVKEANCKDKLCEKKGKISKNGEAIICLPHKVVVTIISQRDNEIDAIAE